MIHLVSFPTVLGWQESMRLCLASLMGNRIKTQVRMLAGEALLPTESFQYCPCFNKASRKELFVRKTVRCKLHLHSLLFL